MNDDFGDRMKRYERTTKHILSPRTYTIVRVDGRAFHTHLRKAIKPFDLNVVDAMNAAAAALCKEMSGVRFAYTQSDEISVLLTDLDPRTEPWFGGEIQKIASVSASLATAAFNDVYRTIQHFDRLPDGYGATFDSRVYTIPSRIEVANYFLWRQKDAIRNAVSMAAHAQIPHRELQGVGVPQMQEMLFQREGLNFKTFYPDRIRRGGVIVRHTRSVETSLPVRKINRKTGVSTQGERRPIVGIRRYWAAEDAPDFTLDNGGFLAENIPAEPTGALKPVRTTAFWDDLRKDLKDPLFAEYFVKFSQELHLDQCAHTAWEESPGGIPHKCTDCAHVFTTDEATERRSWK